MRYTTRKYIKICSTSDSVRELIIQTLRFGPTMIEMPQIQNNNNIKNLFEWCFHSLLMGMYDYTDTLECRGFVLKLNVFLSYDFAIISLV